MLRGFNVCAEVVAQPGDDLGSIIGLRPQSFLGLAVPAPLKFGFGLPGCFPGTAALSGPFLVSGVVSLEALACGGQLRGQDCGAGRAGVVVLSAGVGGLPEGVGFGSR